MVSDAPICRDWWGEPRISGVNEGLVEGTRDYWGEPGIGGEKIEDAVEVVSPSDQYPQAI